jgi:hypothetical protein
MLVNVDGKWQVVRIGEASRAAAIDPVTGALVSSRGVSANSTFLVQVPGLPVEFVGFRAGSNVELASLWDSPGLRVAAGRAQAAEEVLASVALGALKSQSY